MNAITGPDSRGRILHRGRLGSLLALMAILGVGCFSPVRNTELPALQISTLNPPAQFQLDELSQQVTILEVFSFH